MIERTLVVLKPDCVQRCIMGRVITRFEDAGLKIVGMKMVYVDKELAQKHYTEDISKKHGEHVREKLVDMFAIGPVLAFVLEGNNAIENVRKMVGSTEPSKAAPGTIRGDFGHATFALADHRKVALRNVIHASGDAKDAAHEVSLWFTPEELHTYKTVHDVHTIFE